MISQGDPRTAQGVQGGPVTGSLIGTGEQYTPPPPPQRTVTPQGTGYPQVYPPGTENPPQLSPNDPRTIVMYPYKFADGRVMHFPTRLGDIEEQEKGDLTVTDLFKKLAS